MTQDIRQLLQHEHFDLIHRTAEFKVTQVQAGRKALLTSFVVGEYVLFEEKQSDIKISSFFHIRGSLWDKKQQMFLQPSFCFKCSQFTKHLSMCLSI